MKYSISKKILYIILICIFLMISFYITYNLIRYQNAKKNLKKYEKVIGKFNFTKSPFVIFTEENSPCTKGFNIIIAKKKETPLYISNTISENYISYSLVSTKININACYSQNNDKINSITLYYKNGWLEDFNGDDIWDRKNFYNYKYPGYIFLNGKWISFVKNEFGRPRLVSIKSGEKYFFHKGKGIWQNLEKKNSEYQKLKTEYKQFNRETK